MKADSTITLMILLLSASTSVSAEDWTASSQPDLAELIENAGRLDIETLCTPVISVRRGELMWVPNPDGKTYDLLQWYFKDYSGPTHLVIMDLGTGKLVQTGIPNHRQIHVAGRAIGPDGKLYLATPDRQEQAGMDLFSYDPATNSISGAGIVVQRLGGERRSMSVGTDGKIYGTGSYWPESQVGAYQLDPATGKITDYGPIGPSHYPDRCWGDGIGADERYIYLVSGRVPDYLVAYDKLTGNVKVLLTTAAVDGEISITPQRYGNTALALNVAGVAGGRRDYWLYQGQAILRQDPAEEPPWPMPADRGSWSSSPPRPEVSLLRATPDSSGRAEILYRSAETQAVAQDEPLDIVSERTEWRSFSFTVPTYPRTIHRLSELADGRIFGTAGSYAGNFTYDPETNACSHLGKIPLSHYATVAWNGKLYMTGYSSAPLYVYDPARPWTALSGSPGGRILKPGDASSNPRLLCRLADVTGASKNYAAAVGADGRIYLGGKWARDGDGGAFSWWDPESAEAGGVWRKFSNYQINTLTSASEGR